MKPPSSSRLAASPPAASPCTASEASPSDAALAAGAGLQAESVLAEPSCAYATGLAPPLVWLRELLQDAADLAEWFPTGEGEKFAKAALLAEQLPRLLEQLEDFVIGAVLEDTAAELTRLGITRELGGGALLGRHAWRAGFEQDVVGDLSSYMKRCELFEEQLRRKYMHNQEVDESSSEAPRCQQGHSSRA